MTTRRFEFSEGTSNKFWTITLDGSKHSVNYGRIGTNGQTSTAEFGSEAEARKSYDKLVAEKLKKGYVEKTAAGGETPVAAAPVQKAAPKPPPAAAPQTAAAPPASPAKPAAPKQASQHALDLHLTAYSYVPGRRSAGAPLAPPEPFDLEDCLKRLRQKVRVKTYGWEWDFWQALPDRALSPQEAEFWLIAMTREAKRDESPDDFAAKMQQRKFTGKMPAEANLLGRYLSPRVMQCLVALTTPDELRTLILDPQGPRNSYVVGENDLSMRIGFRIFVLPYLDEAEIPKWQAATRQRWGQATWPVDYYTPAAPAYYYGAMFGLHDEVCALAAQWPDDRYANTGWDHTHYQRPQEVLYGAGSAEQIAYHFRRLNLPTNKALDIQTLLAVAGVSALDVVVRTIASIGKKEDAEELFADFDRIHAPEAAPHVLDLALNSKAPKAARTWLENNLDAAIGGLLPVAAGSGKLGDAATEFLLSIKRRGESDRIAALLGTVDAEVATRVRAKVLDVVEEQLTVMTSATTPAWWTQALTQTPLKKSKPVTWIVPTDLPAITVGEHALGPDHIGDLLNALQTSTLEAPHPLLSSLREHGSRERLDAFAWKLFESWLGEGAPTKDKWAFLAAGFLGGDRAVLKLAPMIREWPGESQHQRAVLGLEVLRTIGTDTALMQINGIAQKVKFKGLKERAVQCMDAIAASRNMSRAQLEDRIVPDCGLDERGERTFDFGPRQFRFVLGPELKPMIRYPDGAAKTDLPKPGAKDDAAKATPAVAEWKLLKKQIADVAKIQAVRLEQAMVTGRRWSGEEFDKLILHHPLMVHLARLLVWATYDGTGKVTATFRVTEDQTLADSSDNPFNLAADATVGILHPMQVSGQPQILEQWGQLFGDYEIVPPFPQLGRPAYHLTKEQLAKHEITHFETRGKLVAQTLVFGLEKLGWQRGVPADAGWVGEHSKQFPGANLTAVVDYEEGFSVGYWEGAGEQTIKRLFFVPGLYTPQMYPEHKNALKLSEVDPIALSEVLGDCELLLTKAK
jgi:predicted DNA-binding WGR domain protein